MGDIGTLLISIVLIAYGVISIFYTKKVIDFHFKSIRRDRNSFFDMDEQRIKTAKKNSYLPAFISGVVSLSIGLAIFYLTYVKLFH